VVLDQLDPSIDRRIAAHVIRGHMYRPHGPGALNNVVEESDDDFDGDESDDEHMDRSGKNSVWQRSLHKFAVEDTYEDNDPHSEDLLQQDFLRKYLHFAKTRMKPVLTDEAREEISIRYAEMRSRQDSRTLPITARSLETIIRLASANAKARLNSTVEADPDVKAAIELLGFALYHENNQVIKDGLIASSGSTTNDISIIDNKRKRGTNASLEEGSFSQEEIMRRTKEQIWDQLSRGEGELLLVEVCKDIENRELVTKALAEIEKDERVMIADGLVFQI